nr:PREDICTED: uncharacterized protein LOC106705078 [Latimeria chalumnae]|eukprot:XP_014349164.1 PREDICTED: uncharacterized protein LOC106705078 [Latimeria chalumnae]
MENLTETRDQLTSNSQEVEVKDTSIGSVQIVLKFEEDKMKWKVAERDTALKQKEQATYEDREKETPIEGIALRSENESEEVRLVTSEQGYVENIPLKSVEADVGHNPSKGAQQWEEPSSVGLTPEVGELPPRDRFVSLQGDGTALSRQEPAHIMTVQGSLMQEVLESSSTRMPSKETEIVALSKREPDNLGITQDSEEGTEPLSICQDRNEVQKKQYIEKGQWIKLRTFHRPRFVAIRGLILQEIKRMVSLIQKG